MIKLTKQTRLLKQKVSSELADFGPCLFTRPYLLYGFKPQRMCVHCFLMGLTKTEPVIPLHVLSCSRAMAQLITVVNIN